MEQNPISAPPPLQQFPLHDGKHDKNRPNFPSTTACCAALASPLLVATPTLTLAKHPLVPTTLLSVGNLVEPHVFTSAAVPADALLILESTNLNCPGDAQLVLPTAGKLTLSHVPDGRYGFPDASSVCVTLAERSA